MNDPLLQRFQPEQDRRQRLAGLVVQLACEAAALDLLRLDGATEGVALDPFGEIHCDRGPLGECLGEAEVVVGEPFAVRPELVVGDDDADRPLVRDQRHVDPGSRVELASEALVDVGVVEHGVDALAPSAFQDERRSSTLPAASSGRRALRLPRPPLRRSEARLRRPEGAR